MRREVLVGSERRRRWSAEEKARIMEESLRPGAQVGDMACRQAVSRGLVYTWHRAAHCAPHQPNRRGPALEMDRKPLSSEGSGTALEYPDRD
jgi:transposase-like protein